MWSRTTNSLFELEVGASVFPIAQTEIMPLSPNIVERTVAHSGRNSRK